MIKHDTLVIHDIPVFSVLDARQGKWQKRKSYWLSLGIESELGRGNGSITYGKRKGFTQSHIAERMNTSLFDPVLCELMYHWFCPRGGKILDPFAGGSVRGIVAGLMGMHYDGIELRYEQIKANREQKAQLLKDEPINWYQGTSLLIDHILPPDNQYDFIFSCPPYGDLEVYSDDPKDLSNMNREDFENTYKSIIIKSVQRLKDDSFACFVVGNYRNRESGELNDLVGLTTHCFKNAGCKFYNEMVLLTVTASLAFRAPGPMAKSRKIGKCHQNVLVYVKGDVVKATEKINIQNKIFAEEVSNLHEFLI